MTTVEVTVAKHVSQEQEVSADCFSLRETALPPLEPGGILLQTRYIGLEPYMRIFGMTGNWPIGSVPATKLIGEVVESKDDAWAAGDVVKCTAGWRTMTWIEGDNKTLERLDRDVDPKIFAGLAGSGGRSVWLPLKNIASPKAGQTAFVSSAASSCGLAAVQLLKLDGVNVVGSVGSDEKVEVLESLGVQAFNYKTESATAALQRLCPNGVDFFFDMAGGAIRTAVIEAMNRKGGIITIGRIAHYDAAGGPGGGNETADKAMMEEKEIQDTFSMVNKWENEFATCTEELVRLYKAGKLVSKDTVVEGLDALPGAFVGIFHGENIGRMLVKVS